MKFIISLFVLLLLPTIVQAQDKENCLSVDHENDRVSGRVEFVRFEHPSRPGLFITGYKLILLKPRCFDFFNLESQKIERRPAIDELQIVADGLPRGYSEPLFFKSEDIYEEKIELDRYLKPRIGQTITVTGTMQNILTAYYVTTPQIAVLTMAPCQATPKSKAIQKC